MHNHGLTDLNLLIASFSLHFWCKVVLSQYLESSCVSTLKTLRHTVLTSWFTLVTFFYVSQRELRA